jgi:hypothetical protein
VGYDLVPIGEGAQPYPAGARWASPDLDAAAELTQRLVADPDGAGAVGERARDDIGRRHSPAARAPLVAARLAASRAAAADARNQRTRPGFLSRNATAQSVLVRTNRLLERFLPPELR